MVKRLEAAAAVAAIAAVVWLLLSFATSAEPDQQPGSEGCVSDEVMDCVSHEAPVTIPAPTISAAASCKIWLGGAQSVAFLSECLHASRVSQDEARAEELRRQRAIAASS